MEVERSTDAGRWAFGYVGYEAAGGLDHTLAVQQTTPLEMPLVWFGIGGPPISVPTLSAMDPGSPSSVHAEWSPDWTPAEHGSRVAAIKSRIASGDIYQCNLTERMTGHMTGNPLALYRDLTLGQGGGYNAYLDLGRWAIASASPELFFERRGDDVLMRPMKGTSLRGRYLTEDRLLAQHLRTSEKERAENVMIVDLIRNDLSRVSETGSVSVPALFTVEHYQTVLQLTSSVAARLRPSVNLVELFTALFPSGSVTGAPKASSMKIIQTLESEPRGVYCGAIGFVGPPGSPVRARFNVAIRTAAVEMTSGRAVYGTGGGITWGSDPAAEQAEVVAKTAVLSVRPLAFELVETMRYVLGRGLLNRHRHLQRLADSAEYLDFQCNQTAIAEALDDQLTGSGNAVVEIRLARDGSRTLQLSQPPPIRHDPLKLGMDSDPVDPSNWRLYHKTSLRESLGDRRLCQPDVDEVILINTSGELTETTGGTLAIELNGRWWTPPLDSGCLPGIERAQLLDEGKLVEKVLRPVDLETAKALAVVNSVHGWRAARFSAS
jgi:para-aminobenzoate synthetase/4-amino-4-deoxychorismate lyase